MSVKVTESPNLGRVIEFTTDDGPGSETRLLRAAADWMESPEVTNGQIYGTWVAEGIQIKAAEGEGVTLQLFVLPVPDGQSTDDAVSG